MSKEELQRYLSFIIAGFSTIAAVTSLSQLNTVWLMVTLVLSALMAVASAVFLFAADRNISFRELNELLRPEFTARKVKTPDELITVAKLDLKIYGTDSVDYNGLLAWWNCYKGVTVLLKKSEIIGAVGIWPIKKETFERLVAGTLDETKMDAGSICEESDCAPRAYWYFGDILLLKKYRGKMKSLSLELLEEAIRDWINHGNLADEIHICALAFKDKREQRLKTKGQGEEFLISFQFERKGQSPAGYPVYARTMTKGALIEEYETRIKKLLRDLRERNQKRTGIIAQASRTWRWIPAATSMVILIAVLLTGRLSHSATVSQPININENVPEELAVKTAQVLKIGLRDHTHCAVDMWDGIPFSKGQIASAMGPRHIGLVKLVEETLAGDYEVAVAHRCEIENRAFIHLILTKGKSLLSLIITERREDNLPQNTLAATSIASGVPLYRYQMKDIEVAGFETQDHLIFVASSLDEEANLRVASKLAPSVRSFLCRSDI